jgi:hypothetical protein
MNPVHGIYPPAESVIKALLPLANPEADCSIDLRMVAD